MAYHGRSVELRLALGVLLMSLGSALAVVSPFLIVIGIRHSRAEATTSIAAGGLLAVAIGLWICKKGMQVAESAVTSKEGGEHDGKEKRSGTEQGK